MEEKRQRILAAYEALAVVTTHFLDLEPEEDDADDYLETMMVTESLIDCGGFNHRDMVARFRRGRRTEVHPKWKTEVGRQQPNRVLWTGNRDSKTQMGKLRASKDPYYLADDGITDGAAMRMLGVALYFPNFEEMVYVANAVARITHAHIEARLAAVLVALRYRQVFTETGGSDDYNVLLNWFDKALSILRVDPDYGEPLTRKSLRVYEKFDANLSSDVIMPVIAREIGFQHVACSTPVAAVVTDLAGIQPVLPSKPHTIGREGLLTPNDVCPDDWHARHIAGRYSARIFEGVDADTYYSILYPMKALDINEPVCLEVRPNRIFERYREIADALATRWENA